MDLLRDNTRQLCRKILFVAFNDLRESKRYKTQLEIISFFRDNKEILELYCDLGDLSYDAVMVEYHKIMNDRGLDEEAHIVHSDDYFTRCGTSLSINIIAINRDGQSTVYPSIRSCARAFDISTNRLKTYADRGIVYKDCYFDYLYDEKQKKPS